MSNTLFKKGDKIRRKKEDQDHLWSNGDRTLTVSKLRSNGEIQVKELDGYWWLANRFELITAAIPTFEEQLALAKTYVGKKVFYEGREPFLVEKVTVMHETDDFKLSDIVNTYIRKNGWCVMLSGVRDDCFKIKVLLPVTAVQLAPEFTEVTLNCGVEAQIYDDKVMVHGMQFSHAEIKSLAANLP